MVSIIKEIVLSIECYNDEFVVEGIHKDVNGDYIVRVSTKKSRGEEKEDDLVQGN